MRPSTDAPPPGHWSKRRSGLWAPSGRGRRLGGPIYTTWAGGGQYLRVGTTTVQVAPSSVVVSIGTTTQLTATVRDSNGNLLIGYPVSWTSLNPTVATVNTGGLVTGVAPGTATIQASTDTASGSASIAVPTAPYACCSQTDPTLVLAPVSIIARPSYLQPTLMSPFGTTLTRITNNGGATFTSPFNGSWSNIATHNYSISAAWNSDATLLYIENRVAQGGSPGQLYLDGTTYAIRYGTPSNLPGGGAHDQRWCPAAGHANEIIVAPTGAATLWWFDVVANAITRTWTLPINITYLGNTKGNASADGRFVVLGDATHMFVLDMFSYPSVRVGAVFDFVAEGLGGVISHYSMSPSGKYAYAHYSSPVAEATRMFDVDSATLNLSVHVTTGPLGSNTFTHAQGGIYPVGHADTGYDLDGTEWIVGQEHGGNHGAHVAGITEVGGNGVGSLLAIRIPDGAGRSLTDASNEEGIYHASMRNVNRPGWVYAGCFNDGSQTARFLDEIMAVKLDGSGSCQRLCWSRSQSITDPNGCVATISDFLYRSEPHPCPSPDGRRVVFDSNWLYQGTGGDCSAHDYVVDCTPPPRPAVLYPNEPAGYTAFAEHNFSTPITQTSPSATGILGLWSIEDPALLPNMTNVQDLNAPQSPALVFQGKFPSALAGGQTSIKWEGWDSASGAQNYGTEMLELYLSLWLKILGADFEASTTADTRIAYLGYAEPKTGPGNQGGPKLKLDTPQIRGDFNVIFQQVGNVSRTLNQNVNTNRLMMCGIWHQWEILCKLNTLGTANGVLRWWLDGALIMNYTDITYITAGNTLGFYAFKFWPYWGGTGEAKTRDDYIQVDHLYISGKVVPAPPPPPSVSYPNQPTGYTSFAEHNFTTPITQLTPTATGLQGLWSIDDVALLPNMTNQLDSAAPFSPPGIFQGKLPAGLTGGATSIKWEGWDNAADGNNYGTEMGEIYLSIWVKLRDADYENQAVGTKMGFIAYAEPKTGAGNQSVLFLQGSGSQSIGSAWKLQFKQQNNVSRDLNQNVNTTALMTCGAWHRWEVVLKLNTVGSANGVFQWWIDGTQILNYSDVTYVTPGNTLGFYAFKFWPVWGGIGGSKTRDDYIQVDHLYISGKPILPGFYVSPTGSPAGNGSWINPWDLQTALSGASGVITPGSTVWLRGGTYIGAFTSGLAGTATQPIIVRQYPGERATIDGNLLINGHDTWYWGFEVISSVVSPVDLMAIDTRAPRTKLINLVIHDAGGNGVGLWTEAPDSELYGSIIYNNGRQQAVSGFAHGVYIQNNTGTKLISDNFLFDNLGVDFHAFGSSAPLNNIHALYNIGLNTSRVATGAGWILLTQLDNNMNGALFNGNMIYGSRTVSVIALGPSAPAGEDLTFTNNYIWGGTTEFKRWTKLTATGNTFAHIAMRFYANTASYPVAPGYIFDGNHYFGVSSQQFVPEFDATLNEIGQPGMGFAAWRTNTGYDATSTSVASADGKPTTNVIVVRPNAYETGRGNVMIYNWQQLASVDVDLSAVLTIGAQYEIRNVQDFWGAAVVSGTYNGGSVAIPMTAITPPTPLGGWAKYGKTPPPATGPECNGFVVITK